MGRLTIILLALVATLPAANDWPCVSRKSPDRSYVDIAETTGGQVILAAPGEIEKTTFLHIQRPSHSDTVYRSTGSLYNETREFRFPVDSTIESLLVSVMLACKGEIAIFTGQGTEPPAEATEGAQIKGGRIARILRPQPGEWTLHLRGNGFYSIVVEAKSTLHYSPTPPTPETRYRLTGDEGQTLMSLEGPPPADLTAPYPRYRVAMEGADEQGFPFQRLTRQMLLSPPANPPK
ncbi:MAG: hypothetical protein ABI972_07885 [Acidobacteriota bacterium]